MTAIPEGNGQDRLTPARARTLGAPGLWRADPAHAVVSIVELRSADHGCEFALHASTVELDSRTAHTSLDLRVATAAVACAHCGAPLVDNLTQDTALHWSAAHCVMASATHPNLLVATGTLSVGSFGRPIELVGSATVRNDLLFLHVTGTLPAGALAPANGRTPTATTASDGPASASSITLTAQLERRDP